MWRRCLGAGGFLARLLFWMIFPAVLVLLILVGSFVRLIATCSLSGQAFLQAALPNILRLLFLFYPIVTNTAFEAFSCVPLLSRPRLPALCTA